MNLQRALKTWTNDKFCDECLHLLQKKDGDADWRPFLREAMSRILAHEQSKRATGKPVSVREMIYHFYQLIQHLTRKR